MESKIKGKFYDEVILQLNYPEVADISEDDYPAKTFRGTLVTEEQHPFIIAEKEEVTLKVEPWNGVAIVWTFTPGPYPMPLRKIFTDAGNSKTSIQISY